MKDFDPKTPLVMAESKTADGQNLRRGDKLKISKDPAGPGEVSESTARLLYAKQAAIPAADFRPTPVETKQQEAARLLSDEPDPVPEAEAPADTVTSDGDQFTPAPDLVTWQHDDEEAGRKAGDKVTNADLVLIAGRETVDLPGDATKADMQRLIMEAREAEGG